MNKTQQDELLIRLDERTANIYTLTEKQERHLAKLNDSVAKNVKDMAENSTRIAENTQRISSNRRAIDIIWRVFLALISCGVLGGGIYKLLS